MRNANATINMHTTRTDKTSIEPSPLSGETPKYRSIKSKLQKADITTSAKATQHKKRELMQSARNLSMMIDHLGVIYCIVAFTVMTDLPEPYGPFPTP